MKIVQIGSYIQRSTFPYALYNFASCIKREERKKKKYAISEIKQKILKKKEPVPCSTHTCLGSGEREIIYFNF